MAGAHQISANYPYLSVRLAIGDWQFDAQVLMDTGFEGSLVIPNSAMSLGLGDPDASSSWLLADGSTVETPVYLGAIEILGLPEIPDVVIAVLGDDYILGRRVIDRYEVTLDHGQ